MNIKYLILLLVLIHLNWISCGKVVLRAKVEPKAKIIIHESNMYEQEIDKCKNVLIKTLNKTMSSKKTARVLKQGLDKSFKKEQFKFSVIIDSNVTNILGKKLYGLWISLTANKNHYLLISSYPITKGKKITEAQMDRIEDWTSTSFITYENVTNNSKFDKVSSILKQKLDINYGKGNAWAVICFKQKYNIRAKELDDKTYGIEFSRLKESHWLIFRGGEDISFVKRVYSDPKLQ